MGAARVANAPDLPSPIFELRSPISDPAPISHLRSPPPLPRFMIKSFEDLDAWKQARALVKKVYGMTRTRDLAKDFSLRDQIRRASVSVMSNLAEGFERLHLQEKVQFYNIARGSNAEVRSLLYVIEDNFSDDAAEAVRLRGEAARVGQIVTGLLQSTEARKR
jgi:four helix bundle protein